ncbi:MAG: acyl-CoA thioesterase [Acinetobacter populi]|jgi:acyl-CoA thioester hydrolase|uniref:acyl-CoA thioesterase n=1 Tax=Acinetobacter populi TaxID=1582270 RepID=UPI0030811A13|nr:acyl-CoA thioesterase [Acinetobacter populi]
MGQLFEQVLTVQSEHLDVLGHVNNVTYVSWMQDVALGHTTALGLTLEDYLQMNHAMVASEHHVKYRKACLLGDQLILRTWLGELGPFSSVRHYLFYRPTDQSIVFQGHTVWVCVEISTGKLKRLSPTFVQAYQPLDPEIDPTHFASE